MAKGRKTGGRQKGVSNKVTTAQRSAFLATFGRIEGDLETWIRRGAEGELTPLIVKGVPIMTEDGRTPIMVRTGADPLKAAAIVVQMAEFHSPKLGRLELDLGKMPADQILAELERRAAGSNS